MLGHQNIWRNTNMFLSRLPFIIRVFKVECVKSEVTIYIFTVRKRHLLWYFSLIIFFNVFIYTSWQYCHILLKSPTALRASQNIFPLQLLLFSSLKTLCHVCLVEKIHFLVIFSRFRLIFCKLRPKYFWALLRFLKCYCAVYDNFLLPW